ncbi:MAG: methionyl-tRNA formyltransferase [Patescibacteria group bacterium]|nr:methionyl-tRNA formyltransferase [Patescibacteria group bacterium]
MKLKKNELRMAFFGTPDFATYVLQELRKASLLPLLVVTQPDKPRDRGLEVKAPAVKEWGYEHEIPVLQPDNFSEESPDMEMLWNSEWDLFVVAAYGKFLPKDILNLPRFGALNVHPSLLPKFRGPSPIESAIREDEKETGVSIILLDEEPDHGPILAQASIIPEPWPFKRSALEDLLWHAGGELLAEAVPPYVQGTLKPVPQDHSKATFTQKLKKEDGLIDLRDDGYKNYLKFCAYEGWPGTFFFEKRNGKEMRVKIIDAKYEDGKFIPLRVIPEGKKEINYEIFNVI